jgi:hypothetical protein
MHTESVLEGLDTIVEEPSAPEPVVDTTPPADKPAPVRDEAGKFKGSAIQGQGKPDQPEKEPAKAAEPAKEEPKTIPLAAHLEERNKLRAEQEQTKAQLKALQDEIAKLKEPPKPTPASPDFASDPKGYVDHNLKSAIEKLEGKTEQTAKTAEQAAQESAQTRFHAHLQQTEQQFLTQQPDYYEALNHLRQIRVTEITTLNPELTQEQVLGALRNEELQLAAMLVRNGRDPHQVAYQLAKARGYAPKAKDQAPEKVLPDVPGQKVLPPDQTLGSGSGSPNSGESFLEDDEVFDKAFGEMFGKRRA